MRIASWIGAGIVLAGGVARADGPMDGRINAGAVAALQVGVPLYNAGDPAGCYRVYQGALTALSPLLADRPELKAAVDDGLRQAEAQPAINQRAFALRKVLDQVYESTRGAKPLWERLGGEKAVKAVVHDFVGVAAADARVDFTRGGKFPVDAAGVAHLEELLVQLISATTGGPLKYEGRDMKSSHQGMKITEAQFNAIAADLIGVLRKYKVPQKEMDELVAIVASTKKDIVEAP